MFNLINTKVMKQCYVIFNVYENKFYSESEKMFSVCVGTFYSTREEALAVIKENGFELTCSIINLYNY